MTWPHPVPLQPLAGAHPHLLNNLTPLIEGVPVAPLALERVIQGRFRLLGTKGMTGMAIANGLSLVRLLGGKGAAHPGRPHPGAERGRRAHRRAALRDEDVRP